MGGHLRGKDNGDVQGEWGVGKRRVKGREEAKTFVLFDYKGLSLLQE